MTSRNGGVAEMRRRPPRLPFPQVVLHPALTWLAEQSPRFPAGTRHHRHVRKLTVGVLGTISAAQGLHDSNDLPAFLEARADERSVNQVGHKRIGSDKHVRSRN